MRGMRAHLPILLFVVACGGGGGGGGGTDGSVDIDAPKVFLDAPPNVPPMITLSGKTSEDGLSGTTIVTDATIAAFASSNETTAVATATSDAQGNYSLTITTNGLQFDGYLKATKTGYIDIYLYPTAPYIADSTGGDINMLTPSNYGLINTFASGNQQSGTGLIGLAVVDANDQPVAGATVTSTPAAGAYRYMGSNGIPSGTATETAADGVAFMFSVPDGAVTIKATKAGATFKTHVVKAHADKFTTTSITE